MIAFLKAFPPIDLTFDIPTILLTLQFSNELEPILCIGPKIMDSKTRFSKHFTSGKFVTFGASNLVKLRNSILSVKRLDIFGRVTYLNLR